MSLGSSAAQAQDSDPRGFYIGANAGIAKLNSARVTYYDLGGTFGGTGSEDTLQTKFRFKDAFTFGGALGYDFGHIRTDLEVSYARNRVKSFTVQSVNGTPITLSAADRADICDFLDASCSGSGNTFSVSGSRARQLNALGNVWFELPVGGFTPYAGGGVGVSGFEVDGDGKAKFAWQLGAGAAFNVSRTIALTLDYRHRQAGKTTIDYDSASGLRLSRLKTDTLLAGVRIYFGGGAQPAATYAPAPVAAPPPPPAPEPVQQPMAPPPPPPAPSPSAERG